MTDPDSKPMAMVSAWPCNIRAARIRWVFPGSYSQMRHIRDACRQLRQATYMRSPRRIPANQQRWCLTLKSVTPLRR